MSPSDLRIEVSLGEDFQGKPALKVALKVRGEFGGYDEVDCDWITANELRIVLGLKEQP